MNLWFNEWQRGYLGWLFVIEKIVQSETRDKFATAEDIRNDPKYIIKLKRARL